MPALGFVLKEPRDAERIEGGRALQGSLEKDLGRCEERVDVHTCPAERRRRGEIPVVAAVLYPSRSCFTAWPATHALGLLLCLSGMDAAGQQKFRAVDDFTRSDVNAQTAPTEKLSCDTLDAFCEILRIMAASNEHEVCC